MIPKFFDIANNRVVLNHNCLSIPELKALVDKYEDPLPAFNYIHYMVDPQSPYANLSDELREETLLKDFPGEYTLEDEEMIAALDKIKMLYITPSYQYYFDS
jgi:hypothetical protein